MQKQKVVIIIPTYNEKPNILKLIHTIESLENLFFRYDIRILVVDDSSPDGTGQLITEYSKIHPYVSLLSGEKQGLGKAYLRGMYYALNEMQADIVFEMDSDFSHNPLDIPRFLNAIEQGADFVIGSRYTKGGTLPSDWPFYRRLNSLYGNLISKFFLWRLFKVKDATSGYRAIKADLLRKIDLGNFYAAGYAFQIEILFKALGQNAVVKEIPIHFKNRVIGHSKLSMKDVTEYIKVALSLSATNFLGKYSRFITAGIIILLGGLTAYAITHFTPFVLFQIFIVLVSTFIIVQSTLFIYATIYGWIEPKKIELNKSPERFASPSLSFTALLPARHEERVIRDTIRSINNINYPSELKEVLVICREDDTGTINEAIKAINESGNSNIKLIIFNDYPINKPHGLNVALEHAKNDVLVIFDAEDSPHQDIYNIVNTVMKRDRADVVQSGVQLMNFRSNWFSTLNVLEYFFWFKSALHLFNYLGVTPLGGNTVFFKKNLIQKMGGWCEHCLTEDAEIGINLSKRNIKIRIIYDGQHATQEETPPTMMSFIKQRTRWNQGFLQILLRKDWMNLKGLKKKIIAAYLLSWPEIQTLYFLYLPISFISMTLVKLPVVLALYSMLPLYFYLLMFVILNAGLYEFTKEYHLKYSLLLPFRILITSIPYQILLGISAVRASLRLLFGNMGWEKTTHVNAHRKALDVSE